MHNFTLVENKSAENPCICIYSVVVRYRNRDIFDFQPYYLENQRYLEFQNKFKWYIQTQNVAQNLSFDSTLYVPFEFNLEIEISSIFLPCINWRLRLEQSKLEHQDWEQHFHLVPLRVVSPIGRPVSTPAPKWIRLSLCGKLASPE